MNFEQNDIKADSAESSEANLETAEAAPSKNTPNPKPEIATISRKIMKIRCKNLLGSLDPNKFASGGIGKCIQLGEEWLTPNEFEIRAGSRAKKYKVSIKCEQGITIGEYIEKGYLLENFTKKKIVHNLQNQDAIIDNLTNPISSKSNKGNNSADSFHGKCEFCEKTFDNFRNLTTHIDSEHRSNVNILEELNTEISEPHLPIQIKVESGKNKQNILHDATTATASIQTMKKSKPKLKNNQL